MSNNLLDSGARFNCGLGSLGGHGGLPFGMDLDIAVQLESKFLVVDLGCGSLMVIVGRISKM